MDYQIIIDSYIGDWMCSASYIREKMKQYKGKHIDVLISSLGGSAIQGLKIFQMFRDHGDVTVHLHGFVASAATIIAMGAKEVKVGKYALVLIHRCMMTQFVWQEMNATEIEKFIKELKNDQRDLESIDNVVAQIYADRMGLAQDKVLAMMNEAAWHNAQWCIDNGFAAAIIDDKRKEVDDKLKAVVAAAGYPELPEKKSIVEKIANALSPKKIVSMKKIVFALIAAVIGLETLEVEEGKGFEMSAEHLGKLEAALQKAKDDLASANKKVSDAAAKIDALTKERDSLKDEVKSLQDDPADESSTKVEDNHGEASDVDVNAIYNNLKSII